MKIPCSFQEWRECFCSKPPNLNTIRGGITTLLKYCFSDSSHYADNEEYLGCLTYSEDPKENKLNITAAGAYDPGNTQLIPGIFVSLMGEVQFSRLGLQNTTSLSRDTARRSESLLATTNVQIKCSHRDADISCAMADTCLLFLFAAIQHMKNAWGWLRHVEIKAQTEPKLAQQSETDTTNKWYDSTLVIQLVYQYSIIVDTESKRLKEYTLDNSVS